MFYEKSRYNWRRVCCAKSLRDTGIVQEGSAGNWGSHIDTIREANRRGMRVYLAGFNSGTNEISLLGEKCDELGIENESFFLDPTFPARPFSGKVYARRAFCLRGGCGRIFAADLTEDHLDSPENILSY